MDWRHLLVVVTLFWFNCWAYRIPIETQRANTRLQYSSVLRRLIALKLAPSDCLQIVVDHEHRTHLTMIAEVSIPVIVREIRHLERQNIFDYDIRGAHELTDKRALSNYHLCSAIFILYPKSSDSVARLLENGASGTSSQKNKRFYPHTKIVVFGLEKPIWNARVALYIRQNALYVLWMSDNAHDVYAMNRKEVVRESEAFGNRMDPSVGLVDGFSEKDEIRVSTFQCIPNVIYYRDKENNKKRMDGIEIRVMNELDHYWTVVYVSPPATPSVWDYGAQQEVKSGASDMALCSTWLRLDHYHDYDLTNYLDCSCGTFLVPTPMIVDSALNPYLPLTSGVWVAFFICFLASVIALTILAKYHAAIMGFSNQSLTTAKGSFEHRNNADDIRSQGTNCKQSVVRAYLDLINIATSHGIQKFPNYASGKIILVCWSITTLQIGVAYSTGYTSLQSSPVYRKSVDTAKEFVNAGLIWATLSNKSEYAGFLVFEDTAHHEMYARISPESDPIVAASKLVAGQRYAVYVDVVYDNYLAYIEFLFQYSGDHHLNLRRMKTCFDRYFTTIALQKHSPYSKFVNDKVVRFLEGGFYRKWYEDLRLPNKNKINEIMRQSSSRTYNAVHVPKPLAFFNAIGALTLLFVGLGASLLVFVVELCRHP